MNPLIGRVPYLDVWSGRLADEVADSVAELDDGSILIGSWVSHGGLTFAPSPTGDYSATVSNDGYIYVHHSLYTTELPDGSLQYILPPELEED